VMDAQHVFLVEIAHFACPHGQVRQLTRQFVCA
jgi:hypothetical protein